VREPPTIISDRRRSHSGNKASPIATCYWLVAGE
jgi:hypothetical protein